MCLKLDEFDLDRKCQNEEEGGGRGYIYAICSVNSLWALLMSMSSLASHLKVAVLKHGEMVTTSPGPNMTRIKEVARSTDFSLYLFSLPCCPLPDVLSFNSQGHSFLLFSSLKKIC